MHFGRRREASSLASAAGQVIGVPLALGGGRPGMWPLGTDKSPSPNGCLGNRSPFTPVYANDSRK